MVPANSPLMPIPSTGSRRTAKVSAPSTAPSLHTKIWKSFGTTWLMSSRPSPCVKLTVPLTAAAVPYWPVASMKSSAFTGLAPVPIIRHRWVRAASETAPKPRRSSKVTGSHRLSVAGSRMTPLPCRRSSMLPLW